MTLRDRIRDWLAAKDGLFRPTDPGAPFGLFLTYRVAGSLMFLATYHATWRPGFPLDRLSYLSDLSFGVAAIGILVAVSSKSSLKPEGLRPHLAPQLAVARGPSCRRPSGSRPLPRGSAGEHDA